MARLMDKKEMQLIYEKCVSVYNKELTANAASKSLTGKTNASESSLKMYFSIYASMRRGLCYKMGTSAAFTRFLIECIYNENGQEALLSALAAAKQNAEYRKSCGNEQPGIEATCREIIDEYALPVSYEGLDQFYGKKATLKKLSNRNVKSAQAEKKKQIDLCVSISYGDVLLEVKGDPQNVVEELQSFSARILPQVTDSLGSTISVMNNKKLAEKKTKKKKSSRRKTKEQLSPGKRVLKKYPEIAKLAEKKDFKARMIPLMFLSDEANYEKIFSIRDIQELMLDAIQEMPEKKQIEDVFARRADWFEKVNHNPRRYKLLDIAKDYARNILNE